MAKKTTRFFNVCPRSRRKAHKERLKDFTAPKPLDAAPILPHYEIPAYESAPSLSKVILFDEIRDEYDVNEFKLLRAIVIRAYSDITLRTAGEDMRDARGWILSSDTHPFSFLWVCEHLDLSDSFVKMLRKTACATFN